MASKLSSPPTLRLRHLFWGGALLMPGAFAATACSDDASSGTFVPGVGGNGSGTGGRSGEGGLGGDGSGGDAGASAGGTGGTGLPTSCEGVECRLGTCDDSSGIATCECDTGFEYNGDLTCVDTDECASGADMCGADSSCVNTNGGFYCDCDPGFRPSTGTACSDVNECAASPCAASATCTNVAGGFTCACGGGTPHGDGLFCKATNDCSSNHCGANGTCINTPSGHVCQCNSGYSGTTSCTNDCATVSLSDAALLAAVREAIGKASGTITAADVANLTYLDASGRNIASLSGLECIPSLQTLLLSNTNVTTATLAVVQQLNRLRQLDLSCTPVTNLGFVAEHPTLERLEVNSPSVICESQLTNVSGVTTALALKQLTLQGHGITSLANFGNLKRLQALALGENAVSDASPLAAIPALQQLYLADNDLTNLSGISSLTELRDLDLSGNPLANLTGIGNLVRLESLRLDNLGLTALPDLSSMTRLRSVAFSFNQVTSLQPLANLPAVHWIYALSNQITTVEPLVGTAFQGVLVMSSNPLDCGTEKEHIDALIAQGANFIGMMCP